ncbi:hypothetical protein M0R45_036656 [Rubus argutus]|uniref:Uncharacterized protein n=1 Tax=Rubus argutus TaxID=59490 RepID=A0AAW1W0J3_RUBAR
MPSNPLPAYNSLPTLRIDTSFTITAKSADDENFGELYAFEWTTLLILPTTILTINLVGVVAGISDAHKQWVMGQNHGDLYLENSSSHSG